MKHAFAFLLAAFFGCAVHAQDRAYLSKAEVDGLATGKKWTHVRSSDQNKVRWDLRAGGALFANNLSVGSSDAGKWSMNDLGQLCVKWRGTSTDRCIAVSKEGEKLLMIDSGDLKSIFATLEIE